MIGSKKTILSLALALLMGGLLSNVAFAHLCTNPNINDNAVVGTFDVATGTFTLAKDNGTSLEDGTFNGAWVKLVFPWGDSYNIFVRHLLPDGARLSGPGGDGCDGKGIDDLDDCLTIPPPA